MNQLISNILSFIIREDVCFHFRTREFHVGPESWNFDVYELAGWVSKNKRMFSHERSIIRHYLKTNGPTVLAFAGGNA